MRLLLDRGNTRFKWALADANSEMLAVGAVQSLGDLLREDAIVNAGAPSQIALSCVAGSAAIAEVEAFARQQWRMGVTRMQPLVECAGLVNGYTNPFALGVDRWLAMLGARSRFSGAIIVVDAGTALTIDAIASDGHHLGGYIVPGVRLQYDALARGTASVQIGVAGPTSGWGRDTNQAVVGGVLLELAAFVQRAVVVLETAVADTCSLVVTGGDAELLADALEVVADVDRELLFRGMLVQLAHAAGHATAES